MITSDQWNAITADSVLVVHNMRGQNRLFLVYFVRDRSRDKLTNQLGCLLPTGANYTSMIGFTTLHPHLIGRWRPKSIDP